MECLCIEKKEKDKDMLVYGAAKRENISQIASLREYIAKDSH